MAPKRRRDDNDEDNNEQGQEKITWVSKDLYDSAFVLFHRTPHPS